jgi:hypothetical protein
MVRRQRRICFRLTHEEEELYLPLLKNWETPDWSHLVRKCLKAWWVSKHEATSDNPLAKSATTKQTCPTPDPVSDKKPARSRKKPAKVLGK